MVVFMGNFGYFVNVDVVGWWVEIVWLRFRIVVLEVCFVFVGD